MKCKECGTALSFNHSTQKWEHQIPAVNGHTPLPDPREQSTQGPAQLRCGSCMEPVQALGTGGFIHDYAEIGRRLWHVKTKHLPGKGQIIPALVCPDSVVYDVTSGTFDGSGPGGEFVPGARRPLPSIARYKAIHAAMVEYFREELALLPGRDWADIRYRRAQSCNCPTCRGRRDQRD